MKLILTVKEVARTADVQRIVLETGKKDRAEIIAARLAKIKGKSEATAPQATPGLALVLPLESALQVEPGDTVTVTIVSE